MDMYIAANNLDAKSKIRADGTFSSLSKDAQDIMTDIFKFATENDLRVQDVCKELLKGINYE